MDFRTYCAPMKIERHIQDTIYSIEYMTYRYSQKFEAYDIDTAIYI